MSPEKRWFSERLSDHIAMARSVESQADQVLALARTCALALEAGGQILIFGNGGSAAESQHMAAELVGRLRSARVALPAVALTGNSAILTSIANDEGYERVFVRQLEALGRKGDVALGLSTSGASPNVLHGLSRAHELGMHTALLTGSRGQGVGGVDQVIAVASSDVARVQEGHQLICHLVCDWIEALKLSEQPQATAERSGPSPYFCHPSSYVDEGAVVGDGTRIWHFSHVQTGARIGKKCNLGQNVNVDGGVELGDNVKVQNNVSIYRGVVIEDDAFLGPSCVFTNVVNPRSHVPRRDEFRKTRVGRGASIGANATVVCGHDIGPYAFVGAGAVVSRNVAPYALVTGVPARLVGWMCACGVKLPIPPVGPAVEVACGVCGSRYRYESGRLTPDPDRAGADGRG